MKNGSGNLFTIGSIHDDGAYRICSVINSYNILFLFHSAIRVKVTLIYLGAKELTKNDFTKYPGNRVQRFPGQDFLL